MEKKKCNKCGLEKGIDQFSKHSKKGNLSGRCKTCQSELSKIHYKLTKQVYAESQTRLKLRNRLYLYNYLKEHPCVDCGETDPVVLDFDHIDEKLKEGTLSKAAQNKWSIERMNKEIEKCEIRCANCHRRRTAKQFDYYGYTED